MSHRLFALFVALLLLCAGLSGAARAAVTAAAAVESVTVGMVIDPCDGPAPMTEGCPPMLVLEPGGPAELADVPLLPVRPGAPSFFHGEHLPPCPVLQNGHPAPCLAGLLRPPSRLA